ncbi:hypothetical protein ACVBEQ_00375 [Nakamurella sp. GG22]
MTAVLAREATATTTSTDRKLPVAAATPATMGLRPPTMPMMEAPSPSANGIAPASMMMNGRRISGTWATNSWKLLMS